MKTMADLVETHDTMRFEVEGILIDARKAFGDAIPTCLSQSHRAKRTIDCVNGLPLRERVHWMKRSGVLQRFIVLNSAIRILENTP